MIPEENKELFEEVKDLALNPEKHQTDPRYLKFHRDPIMGLLDESKNLVKEDQKEKVEILLVLSDKNKGLD